MSKECPNCLREHTGRGLLCAICNNPHMTRGDGRNNSASLMDRLEDADNRERSEEEGWWYDDDDGLPQGFTRKE